MFYTFVAGDSPYLYRIGSIGYDQGSKDGEGAGSQWTVTIRTAPVSPAGKSGLCHFRRVSLSVEHSAPLTIKGRFYVDGVRTKVYSGNSQVDQEVVIDLPQRSSSIEETVLMELSAAGTFLVVEIELSSNDLAKGLPLITAASIHYYPILAAKLSPAEAV